MPLRRSHKVALAAIGVIAGWISLSAVSNLKQIRLHDSYVAYSCKEGKSEVMCRTASCQYKYYFFIPFIEFLDDTPFIFNPTRLCIRSILDDMNK